MAAEHEYKALLTLLKHGTERDSSMAAVGQLEDYIGEVGMVCIPNADGPAVHDPHELVAPDVGDGGANDSVESLSAVDDEDENDVVVAEGIAHAPLHEDGDAAPLIPDDTLLADLVAEARPPAKSSAADEVSERQALASPISRGVHPDSRRWGVFLLTFVKQDGSRKHGAWQATCPFHAKSKVTGCRKTVNIRAPGDEAASFRAQELVRLWCSTAPNYSRQREHIAWNPHFHELPDPEVLDRSCITDLPTAVMNDEDLDELEAAPPAAPEQKQTRKTKKSAPTAKRAKTALAVSMQAQTEAPNVLPAASSGEPHQAELSNPPLPSQPASPAVTLSSCSSSSSSVSSSKSSSASSDSD